MRTLRQPTPRHDIHADARETALQVAAAVLAALDDGHWAASAEDAQALRGLAGTIGSVDRTMGPVCDPDFADQVVPMLAESAHRLVLTARAAADVGALVPAMRDFVLVDPWAEHALVLAYRIVASVA